jgi:hypothetical protein
MTGEGDDDGDDDGDGDALLVSSDNFSASAGSTAGLCGISALCAEGDGSAGGS